MAMTSEASCRMLIMKRMAPIETMKPSRTVTQELT